jgi:sialate O-acetylesterase
MINGQEQYSCPFFLLLLDFQSLLSMKKLVFIIICAGLLTTTAYPEVKLPKIFGSGMVLQQAMAIPVWGWASPGERITVILGKTTVRATAGRNGQWRVQLPSLTAGGPFRMTVSGRNSINLENVMVGEVWVCSGQSNMEWPVASVDNGDEEIKNAVYPGIRLFTVPRRVAQQPQADLESGEWSACNPGTVAGFSAVGYFFGRELHIRQGVPVGLIQSAWGGTVAETWISGETIGEDPDFSDMLEKLRNMDLEKYGEEQKEKIRQLLGGNIPTDDSGMANGEPVWTAIDLNDGDWKTLLTPKYWEEQGYAQIDGIAWYRKEIILTEEQTQSNVVLHLGKVDDSDITWMNGFEIGKTERLYDKERVYTIDRKYLRPGKNMLVVRVNDTGGNGGIWGDPRDQFLAIGNEKMDISGDWKFRIAKAHISSVNVGPNSFPTLLFNGMISPIVPFAIRGAIWYQGESNASRAGQYQRIFPALITDWREHWKQGNFPFLYVSLANFMKPAEEPGESSWAELREAQTMALALPNTGMAVAIDIGEANDIHPRNKQEVGRRLYLPAGKLVYGDEIVSAGPLYNSAEFYPGRVVIRFNMQESKLVARDKYGYVKGFTIAGADKKFRWAQAKIIGGDKVEVSSPEVPLPVAVRYGWADNPDDVNLYNSTGLPANPFRTDTGDASSPVN